MKNGNIKGGWELLVTAITLIQGCFLHLKFIKCLNGRFYARTKWTQMWTSMPAIPAPGGEQKRKKKEEKVKNQGETSSFPTVTNSTVTNTIFHFFCLLNKLRI